MDEQTEDLLHEIRDKLHAVCYREWDRYIETYIVPYGKYTSAEAMRLGDKVAYDLIQKINELLARS